MSDYEDGNSANAPPRSPRERFQYATRNASRFAPSKKTCDGVPYQLMVNANDPVDALKRFFLHVASNNTEGDFYEITVHRGPRDWIVNAVWVLPK